MKKKPVRVLFVSILGLAVLFATVLIFIGGGLDADTFAGTLSEIAANPVSGPIDYQVGKNAVLAKLDGRFAMVGSTGISAYDRNGNATFTEQIILSDPVVQSSKGKAVAFDAGGRSYCVFDAFGVIHRNSTENIIISASVNAKGNLALCTEEGGGYKGSVTLFDPSGKEIYKWFSADGNVISAIISNNGKAFAVLTLTSRGSKILFFSTDSTDLQAACEFPDEIVFDLAAFSNSSLLAISTAAVYNVQNDGTFGLFTEYRDKSLRNYALSGSGSLILELFDNSVAESGTVVCFDSDGEPQGSAFVGRHTSSLSAADNKIALIDNGFLRVYDETLALIYDPADITNAGSAGFIDNNRLAVFGGNEVKLIEVPKG